MKPLPLNIQTLFGDLQQKMTFAEHVPAHILRRTLKGNDWVYAQEKHGSVKKQRLLGRAGDPAVEAEAEALKTEAANAKLRRQIVSMLKQALLPAPTIAMGRVLEALSRAGYFDRGLILVGTLAYGTYSPLLGVQLSTGALMTQDADFAVASIAAMSELASDAAVDDAGDDVDNEDDDGQLQGFNRRRARSPVTLPEVLLRADPTFRPQRGLGRRIGGAKSPDLPKRFRADNGLEVELLTPVRNRADEAAGIVPIPAIGAGAMPLPFLDFLLTDAVTTTALYNAGVKVKVPQPARYAVHKLIVAQRREIDLTKRAKDLAQAKELIAVLRHLDEGTLADAFEEARSRGANWRRQLDASLKAIGEKA